MSDYYVKPILPWGLGYWLPYVLIALAFVGLVFFVSWCGDMADEDCRDRGGERRVRTGRYHSICVSADGRILD